VSTDLERFRDHCRRMVSRHHKPECPSLTAREPYWPPGGWIPIDGDPMKGLQWIGPKPKWEPPTCDGCLADDDRDRFRRLADEIDTYLAGADDEQEGLFGGGS